MAIDTIFKQLPEAANACPDLVRVGRYRDVEFLIEVGEHAFQIRVQAGRVTALHPGPFKMRAWHFAIRAGVLAWCECAALVSGLIAPQSPDEYRWETLWHYHQSGSEGFKGDMHFYRTDSEYRRAGSRIDTTTCPVFLMTGEYDYSCTPELTRETAARIPGAEAIIMDGIGHFPMSENPDRFAAFVLPVLDRILTD